MNYHRITVGIKTGAVTAFASDPYGNLFGLTAAHVLAGGDNQVIPQDTVRIWDNFNNWIHCGNAFAKTWLMGRLHPNDYGIIDAGLFSINFRIQQCFANSLKPLGYSPWLNENPRRNLINRDVKGYSVSGQATLTPVLGKITGVQTMYNLHGNPVGCDLVISIKLGNTNEGDSGMLWLDTQGNALALHFAGAPGVNSITSLATFVNRVTDSFNHLQLGWFDLSRNDVMALKTLV